MHPISIVALASEERLAVPIGSSMSGSFDLEHHPVSRSNSAPEVGHSDAMKALLQLTQLLHIVDRELDVVDGLVNGIDHLPDIGHDMIEGRSRRQCPSSFHPPRIEVREFGTCLLAKLQKKCSFSVRMGQKFAQKPQFRFVWGRPDLESPDADSAAAIAQNASQ